jgi:predicted esterase
MEIFYMPPLRTIALFLLLSIGSLRAQTMPEFQSFTYTPVLTWNTSVFQSYQYTNPDVGSPMRFRLMPPNGFDRTANDGKKYPIIIFLHGSGEAGAYDAVPNDGTGEQDNDKHLSLGGQTHRTAVLNNTFPGFLLYPQIRKPNPTLGIGPNWGFDNLKNVEYIIRKLIEGYKVDPDRIYVHGLSLGGEATWRFISMRPDLFAAAHPMSAAGTSFWKNASSPAGYWSGEARQRYKHIPLRLAQGGFDKNPAPSDGNTQVDAIREIGGNIMYDYYANLGHSTWNSEYGKPDFFSWFLSHRKNNIHVYGGQSSFCSGENFSVTLGLTPGFANYQWVKNDTTAAPFLSGASANEVTITQVASAGSGVGRYYARFQRSNGVWTRWSAPVNVNQTRTPSPTPTITTNGQSRYLPSLDGGTDVTLIGNSGKAAYVWRRDATTLSNTTTAITVSTGGTYYLRTREPATTGKELDGVTPTMLRAVPLGCLSADSPGMLVTTQNGVGVPATPGNFFAGATSTTSATVSWMDRASNETGFEIFRTTTSGSGYRLIATLPATSGNPQTYVDSGLLPNTAYYYRMRAVNNIGGSGFTPEASVATIVDGEAPTSPVLSSGATSRTEINLNWTGASDNVGVTEYEVYQNNLLIARTTQQNYRVTGVTAFSDYVYTVKARDLTGNVSVASNQVSVRALNNGLSYEYYHHDQIANISEIQSKGTLIKTGTINNFSIAPRTRNDGYAFIFNGYIAIPTSGAYTFWAESSEGSQLYIDNALIVDHDGIHVCEEKQGNTVTLSAGVYPVRALNFENINVQCLTFSWQGPGIAKQIIPDNALNDSYTPPAALNAPTGFAASAASFKQINLSWTDNSSNETGFEISRSTTSGGTYNVVRTTTAGVTSWSDNTLSPSTQYFYKIRAINATSASPLTGPVNATTQGIPAGPTAPSSLSGTANTTTRITLTWNDNSSNEAGFEIQKSGQSASGYVPIATTAANIETFVDNNVNGHSTTYYRLRSIGESGASSAFVTSAGITTGNRAPVLPAIADRSIKTGSTFALEIVVSDADADPIAITFPNGLPAFATLQSNGYGKGTLTFTNAVAGTYNIRVQASDGAATITDDFVLTVNANNSPVMAAIPAQTVEEGRTLILTASATDADATDVLTYTVANLPSFATWSSSQRRITFKPLANHAGIYENITVTVRDNKTPAGIDSKTFTLIVSPVDNLYTVAINFTMVPELFEGVPWNNTGMPTTSDITNLVDENNTIVRSLALNTGTTWTTTIPQAVDLPYAPNAAYTEKVRESYYRRSGSGSGSQLKIKGLNPSMEYKLTIYGAGGWMGSTPPANLTVLNTRYVIAGAVSQQFELNTLNNTTSTITTNLMKPSAAGEIAINVMRGTNNTNHYYINAMLLSGYFDDGSTPLPPGNVTLTAPAYDTVKLVWTDNSFETRFDVMRASSLNGVYTVVGTTAANVTTYTDATTAGRTSYYYKVRAVNAAGSADSEPQLITTPNGKPVIASFATVVVKAGQTLQRSISATDPEGDPIDFNALDIPSFATLVDNGNGTGYIRFEPLSTDVGTYSFAFEAVDDFSGRSEYSNQVVVIDPQYDEVVYLNFKGSGSTSNAATPWNNITAFNANTAVKNVLNQSSAIQVRPRSGWTASSNTNGTSTGDEAGIYPDNVMKSYWATSSTSSGGTVTLKGLTGSKRYNITLFGSLNEFWFANTVYTIGGVSKILNVSKNTGAVVKFSGLVPAGDSLVINVKRGANINASPLVVQRDGILGAMIVEVTTPSSIPVMPSGLTAEAMSKSAVRLTWFDNSSDETGFEVYRATSLSGPFTKITTTAANVETYTNTGLIKNTPYVYRVRAIKSGAFSGYTDDAVTATYNQVVKININSTASSGHLQAPLPPWNNLATPPADGLVFSNFKEEANFNTSVDLEILSWENGGTNNTGFKTGNNSGVYPDAVLENYYYYEQFDLPTRYRLTGLNGAHRYDLVFLGNEWSQATTGNLVVATDYSVGSKTVSQYNGKNTNVLSIIRGITPSGSVIPFEIKANDAARYGVWNALEIRSYAPIPASFGGARIAQDEEEETSYDMVQLYPNPVNDRLTIKVPETVAIDQPVGVHIFSAQGLQIISGEHGNREEGIEISTEGFARGVYIIKLEFQGRRVVRRFLKE